MTSEQPLRNPTQEEINSLLKKEHIPSAEIIKTSSIKIEQEESKGESNNFFENVPLKAFDEFEPEPEKFRLPSGSKVINQNLLTKNNEIFVRKLSLKEEGIFSEIAKSEKFFIELNKVLSNCIKTDISEKGLSAIDKIPLIIFILALTYGKEYNIGPIKECKTCDPKNEVILNLIDDIEIKYVEDTYQYPITLKLSFPNTNIIMTMHYPRLLNEDITFTSDNILEQIENLTISISGTKKDGSKVKIQDYKNIITYLQQEDKEFILEKLTEFSQYGIQTETKKFKCSKACISGEHECHMLKENKKIDINLEKIFLAIAKKINKNNKTI